VALDRETGNALAGHALSLREGTPSPRGSHLSGLPSRQATRSSPCPRSVTLSVRAGGFSQSDPDRRSREYHKRKLIFWFHGVGLLMIFFSSAVGHWARRTARSAGGDQSAFGANRGVHWHKAGSQGQESWEGQRRGRPQEPRGSQPGP